MGEQRTNRCVTCDHPPRVGSAAGTLAPHLLVSPPQRLRVAGLWSLKFQRLSPPGVQRLRAGPFQMVTGVHPWRGGPVRRLPLRHSASSGSPTALTGRAVASGKATSHQEPAAIVPRPCVGSFLCGVSMQSLGRLLSGAGWAAWGCRLRATQGTSVQGSGRPAARGPWAPMAPQKPDPGRGT